MKHALLRSLFCSLVLLCSSAFADESGFPGRAKYPEVPVMEKAELMQQFQNDVIVDARSDLEYKTLRIKGAVNIPVASKTFEEQVKALRAQTGKPIVFYCNGRTCMKSYIAAKKAMAVGVTNVHAYDAGMFEWAETYPDYAELLGKSPVNQHDIISLNSFKQRLLDPDDFSNKAYEMGNKSMILDVRDKYQRGAAGLFPGMEHWVSLDKRAELNNYIEEAKKNNKTLFIYDEVGHQVQWLQYALEQAKISNYYFMHNGAKAYYAEMMKQFGITRNRLQ
jgi:rhodanese-related sulfurtransferase